MLKVFSLDWLLNFLSCDDAACVSLSQWKQNDRASGRKQIAFPSAHNMVLACLVEMRRKRTSRAQKSLEGTSKYRKLHLRTCKCLKMLFILGPNFLTFSDQVDIDIIHYIYCKVAR